MQHAPGFLKLVNDARRTVKELTVAEARARLEQNPQAILLDVREESEWSAGHALQARPLGRGVLERDIERLFPDPNTELILYCGGGFRSALACESLEKMGYKNAFSLIGGYKGMVEAGWPVTK